jgi:serine/threonine protein kinase
LVELATGSFPYRDCKTDFEVLTKVLAETPPVLPVNEKFSLEFRSFVANCLIKDYKDRPKYKKLLSHEFILKYDKEDVDVGAWYRSHLKNFSNSSTKTPSNNQVSHLSPFNDYNKKSYFFIFIIVLVHY